MWALSSLCSAPSLGTELPPGFLVNFTEYSPRCGGGEGGRAWRSPCCGRDRPHGAEPRGAVEPERHQQ